MAKCGGLGNLLVKEHTHTFVNAGGDVRALDFRFNVGGRKIGAPFHGLKAFFTTGQLAPIDKARAVWVPMSSRCGGHWQLSSWYSGPWLGPAAAGVSYLGTVMELGCLTRVTTPAQLCLCPVQVANSLALGTSPIVRALFDPEGGMRDVRALDAVSFSDWFKSHGGSQASIDRMWCVPVVLAVCEALSALHTWAEMRGYGLLWLLLNCFYEGQSL